MKRMGLLAIVMIAMMSVAARAEQGRGVQIRAVQLGGLAPIVSAQEQAAVTEPVPVPFAQPNHSHGYGYPGFAWVSCCESVNPCCMNLWDDYCSTQWRWCESYGCGLLGHRCRGCGCNHGCGMRGCNRCGGCSQCASNGCSDCNGGHHGGSDVPPAPMVDQPPQPTGLGIPQASWEKSAQSQSPSRKWAN